MTTPIGILVMGGNHLIVEGPKPDAGQARELSRQWTIIRIGNPEPPIKGWTIRVKAFREDLVWAVVVTSAGTSYSTAVTQLLAELHGRRVEIDHA